jgi:hypothetical protein
MNYQNDEYRASKKSFDKAKRERLRETLAYVTLQDMPLEDRRKEAKKPLFLTRYE